MYAKVRIYYLFQDNTLERTTNGKGIFAEQNSDYIDSLDAGSWFSHSFKGEKIPRFTEYLAWIKGKAKVYIDVKNTNIKEVVDIIREQEIQEDCFFYFRNSKDARKCFWGKAKFEFRISEAKKIKEQFVKGEDVSGHYFLFEHGGNRLNAETVKWCQKNNIAVVDSVNIGHYKLENHMDGAMRDIGYWKNCGITEYQIDSDYDQWIWQKFPSTTAKGSWCGSRK